MWTDTSPHEAEGRASVPHPLPCMAVGNPDSAARAGARRRTGTPRPARLATAALLGLQQTPASSPPPSLPAPPPFCRLPPLREASSFSEGTQTGPVSPKDGGAQAAGLSRTSQKPRPQGQVPTAYAEMFLLNPTTPRGRDYRSPRRRCSKGGQRPQDPQLP